MDIKTFVFLDLECTHLPSQVPPFGPPRITEMALLACRSSQFKRPCRVTDCISLCVRPQQNVCPQATELTGKDSQRLAISKDLKTSHQPSLGFHDLRKRFCHGLDDFNLEHQRTFAEVAPSITSFLRTLEQPICLLAHNGDKFDYPLLRAELDSCGESWRDLDIIVCDTYIMFRTIGDDLDYSCSGMCPVPDSRKENRDLEPQQQPSGSALNDYGMKTPPREAQAPRPNNPPAAPSKMKTLSRFLPEVSVTRRRWAKGHFKLSELYKRIVKKEPIGAHNALADCQMLFQCVLMKRLQFIHHLECSARLRFDSIKPMWVRNAKEAAGMNCMVTRSGRVLAQSTSTEAVAMASVHLRETLSSPVASQPPCTPPKRCRLPMKHTEAATPKSNRNRRLPPRRLINEGECMEGVMGDIEDFVPIEYSDEEQGPPHRPDGGERIPHDRRARVVCDLLPRLNI